MSVPTPSVIISTSFSDIGSLFSLAATKDLDFSKVSENTFLFTGNNNPNIISFEHTFLNDTVEINIEIIDPKDEFVERFITLGDGKRKNNILQTFYIAYGIGTNPQAWSGPHAVILKKAIYRLDGAFRLLLSFSPTLSNYSEGIEDFGLLTNSKVYYSGKSNRFKPFNNDNKGKYRPSFNNSNKAKYVLYDFNSIIYDVLFDYISKIFNNENIVLMLPNFNTLLVPHCEKIYSNIFNGKNDTTFNRRKKYLEQVLSSIGLTLTNESRADEVLRSLVKQPSSGPVDAILLSATNAYIDPAAYLNSTSTNPSVTGEFAATKQATLQAVIDEEKKKQEEEYIVSFKSTIDSNTNVSHLDSLSELIKKINTFSSEPFLPFSTIETDANLIYTLFKKNKIQRPNPPIFIFGDRDLIFQYFYGLDSAGRNIDVGPQVSLVFDSEHRKFMLELLQSIKSDVFGTMYTLPQEFSLSLEDKKRLQIYPIFKYNVPNSNIIRLDMKQDNSYFANLHIGYSEYTESQRSNNYKTNKQRIPDAPKLETPGDIVSYILKQGDYTGLSQSQKDELKFDLVSKKRKTIKAVGTQGILDSLQKTQKFSKMVDESLSLLNYLSRDVKKFNLMIKNNTYLDKEKIIASFFQRVYQQARLVEIETVPLFQVTRFGIPNLPASMVVFNSPIMSNREVTIENRNKFLSGFYRIIGYSHKFDTNSAASSFLLAKQL